MRFNKLSMYFVCAGVAITIFLKSPEPAGSVGLLPQPGYKDRHYFLITKKYFIIFIVFLSGHYTFYFGYQQHGNTCFSRIFDLTDFLCKKVSLYHYDTKRANLACFGPLRP